MYRRLTIGILAALAGLCLTLAVPGQPQPDPSAHPEVGADETCDGCHRELTPETFHAWYGSKHGINNVKCFVCHGSTGEDFTREVASQRCAGCHFEQVESTADESCFTCHPPHRLSPHARKPPFDPPSIPPYDKGGRPRPSQPQANEGGAR